MHSYCSAGQQHLCLGQHWETHAGFSFTKKNLNFLHQSEVMIVCHFKSFNLREIPVLISYLSHDIVCVFYLAHLFFSPLFIYYY